MNRYLSGNHLTLDASAFLHDERALLLNLLSKICENPDGSHNKILCKSFFVKFPSVLEKSERDEISNLNIKWNYFNNMTFNSRIIDRILCNEHVPCAAGFGLKRLFISTFIKHNACCNDLMCGCNLDRIRRSLMSRNSSCAQFRGKEGLAWPHKIAVSLSGLILR